MKKILLFTTAFLYTFCFAGCSDIKKSSQESSFESSETVQSEINKTQLDSESGDEYVYADFEEYNSPAEENGLGGKKIYFDTTAVSIDESNDDIYILDVENNNGNKWICSTRKNDRLKSELNAIIGKEIQVYGEYLGFSEKKKCPAVLIDYIITDQKKTCIFATEEEALEYAEQYSETTEITKEKSEVMKIGEPAETQKWKITALGVKEYSKINGDYSMEYTPENENNIFITIYFEVENLDFEENFFSLMAYSMAIVDGNSISPSYTAMPEKTNNFSMGCEIPAREKMVGGVTFEVSPDWKYTGIAYSETSDFSNNCVFGIYNYDVSK